MFSPDVRKLLAMADVAAGATGVAPYNGYDPMHLKDGAMHARNFAHGPIWDLQVSCTKHLLPACSLGELDKACACLLLAHIVFSSGVAMRMCFAGAQCAFERR